MINTLPIVIDAIAGLGGGVSVVLYFKRRSNIKMQLERNYKPIKSSMIALPPKIEVENTNIELDDELVREYEPIINKFIDTISTSLPEDNLVNFHNNINSLFLIGKKNIIKKSIDRFIENALGIKENFGAYYHAMNNAVGVNPGANKDHIEPYMMHELLHMSSTVRIESRAFSSGFYDIDVGIGKALNEGYTEHVRSRYFPSKGTSYKFLTSVASNVEELVGKEKMENLYFNANLRGLIDELSKYEYEENVIKFLQDMDYLNGIKNFETVLSDDIKKTIADINDFVIKSYSRKIMIEKGNRIVNYTVADNIGEFSSHLTLVDNVLYLSNDCLDKVFGDSCYYDIIKEQFIDPEKYPLTYYFYEKAHDRDINDFDYDKVR